MLDMDSTCHARLGSSWGGAGNKGALQPSKRAMGSPTSLRGADSIQKFPPSPLPAKDSSTRKEGQMEASKDQRKRKDAGSAGAPVPVST